ncbi:MULTISPECIES: ArsR/SmtB family transcription factor [unclassified Janthinobacterium]|jgi:ArsR family transcriptional regulator|uniref:ArsR/SmtB family transcription factor n=1 Tax=unclassified Janthinobacterium TaxID=2610881 RepID=UPI000CCA01F8|nr:MULTISPECIES: metalloregulator ArsR/SmtB family transcription factor [unclassified Janthinobacterium]PKV47521.1 ArsR family transcriptional regulator [Janthinobacterium sp. 61]TDY30354.1 ArsR family transcriptional regulator [Janthinobacterium sp. 75]
MENEKTIADRPIPLTSASAIVALAALAQESRLAVFRLLVQTGPEGMAATKIAEALAIAPSSLSFHLKELAHADLVTASKAGRSIIYAANYAGMNGLLAFLTENCCAGSPCCLPDSGNVPNESTP